MTLLLIILFSFSGTFAVFVSAIIFSALTRKDEEKIIASLLSYAIGTLLGAAFLVLIPESLENLSPQKSLAAVLAGVILFFILEKLVIWRHCHDADCHQHSSAGLMILVGDSFHNFIDGALIAAGFLISPKIGIVIGLTIIAHEIPQEVGEFAILLKSGYKKTKALLLNLLSSLSAILGAIIGYFALEKLKFAVPYVVAFSAASFIYVALADLSPELHKKTSVRHSISQVILIGLGIVTIIFLSQFHHEL